MKFEDSDGNGVTLIKALRAREELWKASKTPQSSFAKSHHSGRSGGMPEREQIALLVLGQFVLGAFL